MSTDARSRYAAAGFVALLIASIFWPSPIVSANRLWLHQPLSVDELSFLGREAPAWDVVFWCVAGLFAIAVVHSGESSRDELRASADELRRVRFALPRFFFAGLVLAALLVALTWTALDAPILSLAERAQSDAVENWIRTVNRLAGGVNPPMIVFFFVIAGMVYRRRRWLDIGIAMALAALASGAITHIFKALVGRIRPELWLGPFHYARGAANSFPSGHTVAAFALGGVLLFASRSTALRVIALTLAIGVAVARVLAFRHWPSDVVASAVIALLAAWIATAGVTGLTRDSATHL